MNGTVTGENKLVGTLSSNGSLVGGMASVIGRDGKSAYEVALDNSFEGTEQEWLESLKGEPGYTPVKGTDYWTEADKAEIVADVADSLPDASLAASKMAWLDKTVMEEQEPISCEWVDGVVKDTGEFNNSTEYKRTDYIDVAEYNTLNICIDEFTSSTTRTLYIAYFNKDKTFLTRKSSGKYVQGRSVDVEIADDVAFVILCGLWAEDTVTISLTGVKHVYSYSVPEDMMPELQDIRIGADGVTYESAGVAVREQINYCIENMEYMKNNRFNVFTKSEREDRCFYNNNGVKVESLSVYSTKLIDISEFESLEIYVDSTQGGHALTFWDENVGFLSSITIRADIYKVDTIPVGAKYIRLAVYYAETTPKILGAFTPDDSKELAEKIASVEESLGAMLKRKYASFSVVGDSFSTFTGFTDPVENKQYYPSQYDDGVKSVRDTWWHMFATETGLTMTANNSYSGSRIATSKGDGQSFVDRANNIGKPDLIIVLGAINDAYSEIGEYKHSDWTEDDLQYFRPALSYLLNYFAEHNAGAKVVFINNSSNATIKESVRVICEYYGVDLLELVNIDKVEHHPTKTGMTQIKDKLIAFLGIN